MHDGQKLSGDRLLHRTILLNRDSSFEKSQASKHIEGETFEILMIVYFKKKKGEEEMIQSLLSWVKQPGF